MTTITTPPTAPSRSDRSTHDARTDAWILWEETQLVPQLNAVVTEINNNAIIAANGAAAATVAIAAANFKGLWSALTGAQPTGISCFHLGAFWILSADVADVTTKVPGTASEWKEAKTINALPYFKYSGAVTNGAAVAINTNGTVSIPAITTESAGTTSTITGANYPNLCYDPVNNKIVAAYVTGAGYLGVVVGTHDSGTGVTTWGAETLINDYLISNFTARCCYDAASGKIVVIAKQSGAPQKGFAAVGTISGTTISFGARVLVTTGTFTQSAQSIVSDPVSGKIVIAGQDNDGSNFAYAWIGTISGTSISFSTRVRLLTDHPVSMQIGGGKLLFASTNTGSTASIAYTAVVTGGTTLTFGGQSTNPAPYAGGYENLITYDTAAKRVLIASSNGTKVSIGSAAISGSSLAFDATATELQASNWLAPSAVYDPIARRHNYIYGDAGNSNYNTMISVYYSGGALVIGSKTVLVSASPVATSITQGGGKCFTGYQQNIVRPWVNYSTSALNYIGIAQDAGANNDYGRVAISQVMVENMTGLTAAAKYYVADNGALTTTETNTFAGTSVSATRLIVKG